MLRLATDADVHGDIVRGLFRRIPDIDLVRVQEVLPEGIPDPEVLAWAAKEGRVLVSNDRNTMVGFAYERMREKKPMPGLVVTTNEQTVGSTIDDILIITQYMLADEMITQGVVYLPLRGRIP